ncbi:MAG: TolC family protein, partial [Azoarcus sp.]|nr:TolC family protein [Azoarcus sp.]
AGIKIDIPFGDLSRRQAEVHARVNVRNQDIRLAEAQQALKREVSDAVRDLDTRWRQYGIARRACELSRRKLEIEREKLRVGLSGNFEVLTYEADLRSAETARINSLIAYHDSQAKLDQTLGTTLESWDIELND